MALVEENGMVGSRSVAYHGRSASIVGSRLGKRADRGRYWSVALISMMIAPMILVLGFSATAPAAAFPSPPIVDLGTAENFVILAKTAISTTGTTSIVGDLGISPAAASYMTGFGETMDASNQFSTSALVTGRLYASNYDPPTPTTMTTAVSDMELAYTDAAGRTTPDAIDLGAGDITSMTLDPGLYKWGTSVSIAAAGVTISGSASSVWIFQMTGDLLVADAAIVTLSGGALASNIFWQVAGQATLGTTSQMKGIILSQTAIVMNNGATLEGRALAQTAVTMDANTVVEPGFVIPEFSQVLIPLVAMMFVVAIVSRVRNQRK
ncbi:MAG TPA: ice-binding family protein [Thermoplasmata archaeon]